MVTIAELRNGSRVFVSLPELAQLLGLSKVSIYRRNWEGGWLQFSRDPSTKRIFYKADDVLKHVDSLPRFNSTAGYEHKRKIQYMEKAREAKGVTKNEKP